MKIEKLFLRNYRCFDEFSIDFPTHFVKEDGTRQEINLHVLLAPNMAGKSAILKALRISVATILSKVKTNIANPSSLSISANEHRVIGSNPFSDIAREVSVSVNASFKIASSDQEKDSNYTWGRIKEDYTGKNTRTINELNDISKDFNASLNYVAENKKGVIPLFMYIGTEYIHQQKPVTDTLKQDGSIKQGYWYCLDDKSMESYVFDWFNTLFLTLVEQKQSSIADKFYGDFAANTLRTFKDAIKAVFPNIIDLDWITNTMSKSNKPILVFSIEGEGARTYDMLSDGLRYLVLLIGEIVTRATLLNKHLGKGVLSEVTGIVMIDEFGIHLHPNLQSDTLSRLSTLFPKLQFIVTTHSPLLINGLRKEQLHLISEDADGQRSVSHPEEDAIGLGAEGILREMFGLGNTFDQISTQQNEEYKILLEKKRSLIISDLELSRFEELGKILAPIRLDPTLSIQQEDPIAEIVRERLNGEIEKAKKSMLSQDDLKERVNSIMDDLFKA